MKRFGIVTIIGDFNCGNRLQNYDLEKLFQIWDL